MIIKQFIHYPNATELGMGNTHECYILISSVNKPKLVDMFPHDTEIMVSNSDNVSKIYNLKAKIGTEFRINQLGDIYRDYNILPGDKIMFTQIISANSNQIFFKVENYNRVYLSVSAKGTEIVNKDRLLSYFDETSKKYSIDINGSILNLIFDKTEKKRSDSPNETEFYKSIIGNDNLRKGEYYITIDNNICFLEKIKKSEVDIYNFVDGNDVEDSTIVNDIAEKFHQYLISKLVTKAESYWSTITSNRKEIQFIFKIIKNELGLETNSIFDITKPDDACIIYEKCKEDPGNSFQNQLCSAILGKYKDFLLQYNSKSDFSKDNSVNYPLQQISYGAPGTGKSHGINEQTEKESVVRTTFHPDSDYSTFVGSYKPTTLNIPVTTVIGTKAVQVEGVDGKPMFENKIVYEFVEQAFLKAYVQAWKNLVFFNGKKQYLVIEEINRGNCAQIFGDLFQLLDRNAAGFSDYPINADSDLQRHLKKAFARTDEPDKQIFLQEEDKQRINGLYKGDEDVVYKVLSGEILLLPNNLYIWATMNTSDQSLFPIDSAFKRRWDWKYVPINYSNTDWEIVLGEKEYSWVSFQKIVNAKIKDATDGSEDKQMGDFFVKAKENVIDEKLLLNKIVFYLWNDVCKDGEGDIFKILNDDKKAEEITFSEFFKGDSIKKLQQWMDFLGVNPGSGEQNDDTAQNKEDFESKKEEEE